MEKTNSYTYFIIKSNGEFDENYRFQATEAGVFDPNDITKILGIEPFRKWKKGDIRSSNIAENHPNSKYRFSHWSAERSDIERLDIGKQCLDTIKNLKHKIPELLKIKSLYDVTFHISIVPHIYNEEQPYMYFGKELIEFCYLTGTEIDVDMYVYKE